MVIADIRHKLFSHFNWTQTMTKIDASNRSTNANAARLQPTSKALASVLLSNG
jgi:hypothetical protein